MAKYAVLQSFYASKTWRSFRANLIQERKPICQMCDKVIAEPKDVIAHHEKELSTTNVYDADTSLNADNVKLLCFSCHNCIHERYGNNERKVYIVYGMPMSGKTTYVNQNMMRGDLIIDMDRIFSAISGLGLHDKPDRLLKNAFAIYDLLIDQAKTRKGQWGNAWIIGGFANKTKRERLSDDLGGELIFVECSREEAIARIYADERRINMIKEYTGYIDKWIENYIE